MPETDDWGVFVDEVEMFASGSPGTGWWDLYIAGQSPERATCLAMTSQGGHWHIACESRKDAEMLLTTMTSQGINPELVEVATLKASRKEAADIPLATIMVKGQDVKIGDDLWVFDKPHRVTRIEPYTHPVVTRGDEWRHAYSDGPSGAGKPWGLPLAYDHGYAASYEVSCLSGDDRREIRPPDDDYPSPFYGEGAALYKRYMADGAPAPWRRWLAAQASEQAGYIQSRTTEAMPAGTAAAAAGFPYPLRPAAPELAAATRKPGGPGQGQQISPRTRGRGQ